MSSTTLCSCAAAAPRARCAIMPTSGEPSFRCVRCCGPSSASSFSRACAVFGLMYFVDLFISIDGAANSVIGRSSFRHMPLGVKRPRISSLIDKSTASRNGCGSAFRSAMRLSVQSDPKTSSPDTRRYRKDTLLSAIGATGQLDCGIESASRASTRTSASRLGSDLAGGFLAGFDVEGFDRTLQVDSAANETPQWHVSRFGWLWLLHEWQTQPRPVDSLCGGDISLSDDVDDELDGL